jgi:hypothetical protein
MLNAQASADLERTHRLTPDMPALAARIGALPERIATPAFELLAIDASGASLPYEAGRHTRASEVLNALSTVDTDALLHVLFRQDIALLTDAAHSALDARYGRENLPFHFAPGSNPARSRFWNKISMWRQGLEAFDDPLTWLAVHAAYLNIGYTWFGTLLARVISSKNPACKTAGDQIFSDLLAIAQGKHPVGAMGEHVIAALLAADRPEGWEAIEKLLLAAQAQEGLRASILSCAHVTHPDAFLRLLKIVRDNNLTRFASVAEWLSLKAWWIKAKATPAEAKTACDVLIQLIENRDDALRLARDTTATPQFMALYRALWATAHRDIREAGACAKRWLKHADPKLRFVALFFLNHVDFSEGTRDVFLEAMRDDDLPTAVLGFYGAIWETPTHQFAHDNFDVTRALYDRLRAAGTPTAPFASQKPRMASAALFMADALAMMIDEPDHNIDARVMLPYWDEGSALLRVNIVKALGRRTPLPVEARTYALKLVASNTQGERAGGFEILERLFLPFADDDPRTAEIISKVLLLARDNEIKDPSILRQVV